MDFKKKTKKQYKMGTSATDAIIDKSILQNKYIRWHNAHDTAYICLANGCCCEVQVAHIATRKACSTKADLETSYRDLAETARDTLPISPSVPK